MQKLELRFNDMEMESNDEGLKVSGYVNKTNQWSQTLGVRKKFVEKIEPGTFRKALQNGNEIHFLAEHDNAKILSSTRNGSLQLREDENGLYMEAQISPTSWGKDYHTLIKDGIIRNMSFGMQVLKDNWNKLNDGTYQRSITDLALFEVSAVRNPAYVQSTISTTRSIEVVEEPQINISEEKLMNNENQLEQFRSNLALLENDTPARFEKVNDTATEKEKEIRGIEQYLRKQDGPESRAMTTATGAIMVPTHLFNEVIEKLYETAPLFSKTRNFTPVNGYLEVLADEDMGAAATFIGENVSITPSDFTMTKIKLAQKRVGTAIEISEETINDSGIEIVEYAKSVLAHRLGKTVEDNILVGTGDANKQFEGILVDSASNKIAVTTATSLSAINMDGLIDFYNSLNPQYLNEAVWVVSRKAFNHIAKLKQSNGDYHLIRDIAEGKMTYELLGQPLFISDVMDNTPDKKLIAFGNFHEGFATMTKRDLKLRHITGDTTQALRGSQMLLLDGFMDGKILQPNAIKVMKMTN